MQKKETDARKGLIVVDDLDAVLEILGSRLVADGDKMAVHSHCGRCGMIAAAGRSETEGTQGTGEARPVRVWGSLYRVENKIVGSAEDEAFERDRGVTAVGCKKQVRKGEQSVTELLLP